MLPDKMKQAILIPFLISASKSFSGQVPIN
jgi:hypothetical protein